MDNDMYELDEIDLIISDINNRYGEWLEMAEDPSALRERIIIQIMLREITEKNFYERELRKVLHRARDAGMARTAQNQNHCDRCRRNYGLQSMEN